MSTDTPAPPATSPAAVSPRAGSHGVASSQVPDAAGRFGDFGGRYVPETLVRALDELAVEYEKSIGDDAFQAELGELLRDFVGRESPLYHARRLSEQCGG
ncbi:MAG: tryptophan synthase subunit beta, partial [Planctomycetota bacterium]